MYAIRSYYAATGTGKAFKLGENCDVDILMVHAPPAEKNVQAYSQAQPGGEAVAA